MQKPSYISKLDPTIYKMDHTPWSSCLYSKDTRVIQQSQKINVIHHIDKRIDKNHMSISINTEKSFDRIQHLFMIKKINVGREGIYLNIIKAIYDKFTTSILSGKKLKAFP